MKHFLFILFFISLGISAQQRSATTDYVILMSDTEMLESAIDVGISEFRDGHFRIVFYGPVVKKLKSDNLRRQWDYAMKYKIELATCKLSMDKLKISQQDLPQQMNVVDNAFSYVLELEQKGYKVLRL